MSEQIHDQVSAFMDDELSSEECAFLVRRLERDPEARSKLVRYSVVGSAMRSELLQPDPDMLRRRVLDALSGAAPPAKPAVPVAATAAPLPRWMNPAFGVGIAATVALAALFTVRALNDTSEAGSSGRPLQTDVLEASSPVPTYVVPRQVQEGRVTEAPPIRLTNYLMHHGEYASRLSRTSVHSNVVGAIDAPAVIEAVAIGAPSIPPSPERAAQ